MRRKKENVVISRGRTGSIWALTAALPEKIVSVKQNSKRNQEK